ncbi:MAG: trypsin-like peptidase domain-containing protein [Anaerolineales bacterium]|nr:trypsin-like peptidase domain-containing protein [Anaerolineales bacterium]
MKPNFFKHFYIFFSVLAIAALACSGGAAPAVEPVAPPVSDAPTNDAGLSSAGRTQLISATVQIFGLFNDGGELVPGYVGSGTILSPSGMILTNAHVASPASQGDASNEPDALGVAIVVQEDKPAVPSYIARVLAVDGFLDLAVIQIVSTVDGSNVNPNSLNLPYVEMGDSDSIHVGDDINIFGFPAIGGNTITFTQGTVSGFSSEDPIGDRAWIKTDTTISGGNSGGLAADNNGRIIGVPTLAAASRDSDTSDCRVVQDTNGDGQIDGNDSCVPIGGFLNGIRPVNLALPLIQSAQNGKEYTSPYTQTGVVSDPGSGNESATDFIWLDTSSATFQECNWSNDTVNSYSDSALCIFAEFEYAGMTNGELLVEYWYLDGEKAGEFSYAWEWDESGLFGTYLANGGDPMPGGTYKVELFAGDNLTLMGTSPEVTVAGGGTSQPSQSPSSGDTVTVYGLVYDDATGKPLKNAYVFVLTPGVTYDEWANEDFADKYISAYLQTGSDGTYKITGIPRNIEFTLVYSAEDITVLL